MDVLLEKELAGVYNVSVPHVTTPYQIGLKVSKLLNLPKPKPGFFDSDIPRPQIGGLEVKDTQKALGINFHTVEQAITEFFV